MDFEEASGNSGAQGSQASHSSPTALVGAEVPETTTTHVGVPSPRGKITELRERLTPRMPKLITASLPHASHVESRGTMQTVAPRRTTQQSPAALLQALLLASTRERVAAEAAQRPSEARRPCRVTAATLVRGSHSF